MMRSIHICIVDEALMSGQLVFCRIEAAGKGVEVDQHGRRGAEL